MPPPLPRGNSQHLRHSTSAYAPARQRSSRRRVAPAVLPARVEHAHVAVEGLLAPPAPHVVGARHTQSESAVRVALDRVRLHVFAQVAGAGRARVQVTERAEEDVGALLPTRMAARLRSWRRACGAASTRRCPPLPAGGPRSSGDARAVSPHATPATWRPPSSVIAKKAPAKNAAASINRTAAAMSTWPAASGRRGARAHAHCAPTGLNPLAQPCVTP